MADKKAIKGVIYLIFVVFGLLVLLIAGNPSLQSLLLVYIGMLIFSIFVYYNKDFRENAIGIRRDNIGKSILFAVVISIGFYIIAKVTGLSIGLPLLSGNISDSIRKITVLFFAPSIETFWIVAVYAILVTLIGKTIWAVLAQAGVFSLAHTSSYILGFYSYPSFTEGLTAFQSNIGSFFAAFIFAFIGMYVLIQPKIKNQIFLITLHFLLNLIITVLLAIIIIS